MRYLQKDQTGLIWALVVWAWTLANIVSKIKKTCMKDTPSNLNRIENGNCNVEGLKVTVYG
tara:strand:- start:4125 stop:4307 length:183 start_codon:yes stop_codon:yes gene_type:complete